MVGNDIIDLKVAAAESNWRRKGFLQKLFSKEEQDIIFNFPKPEVCVWILWAMKESAYKAHQRKLNLPRKFNPKDFHCKTDFSNNYSFSGEVEIANHIYYTVASVEKEFIYCYACSENNLIIYQKIFHRSGNIKPELLSHYCTLYKHPQERISLQKNNNMIPYISYENEEIFSSLSLTHHGEFSAYIFELINL